MLLRLCVGFMGGISCFFTHCCISKDNLPSPLVIALTGGVLPAENNRLFVLCILQDVSGLAVEGFADGIEGGKTDGADLAGLELGEIDIAHAHLLTEVFQANFAVSHDPIQTKNDCHSVSPHYSVSSASCCSRQP